MPSRAHSSVTRRTLLRPRRWPSIRGRPAAGPAAVAVHDDGDVPRHFLGRHIGQLRPLAASAVRRSPGSLTAVERDMVDASGMVDMARQRSFAARSGPTETTSTGRPTSCAEPIEIIAGPPAASRPCGGRG